jgi:hypothetical protein
LADGSIAAATMALPKQAPTISRKLPSRGRDMGRPVVAERADGDPGSGQPDVYGHPLMPHLVRLPSGCRSRDLADKRQPVDLAQVPMRAARLVRLVSFTATSVQ